MSIVLGITGSIGSGKTFALNVFKDLGVYTFSADEIVREEYEGKKEFYKIICDLFGKEVLDENGNINRKFIINKIKLDKQNLKKMNELIHPRLKEKLIEKIKLVKQQYKIIAVEIPILFELQLEENFDFTIVVSSEKEDMLQRIKNRKNWDQDFFEILDKYQMPKEEKIKKADYVIYNNSTLENLRAKTSEIFYKVIK